MKNNINQINCLLIFLVLLLGVRYANAQNKTNGQTAFEQNKKMGRGVNIIGYDPIWNDMDKARMKSKHFKQIKEAGFNHVRIKISPFRFAQGDTGYTIKPSFFKTLDWIIKHSLDNKLMAIIDFHEHGAMEKDPTGTKPMLLAQWKQIAEYYKNYGNEVVFEIANEPNMDPKLWNTIHQEAYQIIRKSNPSRTLLIGTVYGNQIQYLKDLVLPEQDRNIIVAIHYYSPIQFTHQGAPWSVKNKNLSGITWTKTEDQQKAVQKDFDFAANWAKEHYRPLTLGEFGAYEKADIASRALWTDYIARQAELRGWSWSYWQFDSDFILYDIDEDKWVDQIKNALIPQ
ncbi:glycoside hydrolase family 5 protein [Pedobacter jejuensis]|uniref:Glycoside hydrolase family 5 protein n=1 Tax=Pedobacter jejuensis TaxID=1268550 RepID=A0A3N0C133_9SPHI|nr:glycoside hydrolase family 5 protein [Pedobacter jejuensis]RNL55892.1 glycoside hydrolase family 5 protein [Pedobacter jejuensis]